MKNIVLIGMPGCGKSTIGKLISKKLNLDFIDTDKYIEYFTNKSIPELFINGEDYFRSIESECIYLVSNYTNHIISTGGGVVLNESNINKLRVNGCIFFIDRSIENILYSINIENRPLLKSKDSLNTTYSSRIHLYKKYADYIINGNHSMDNTVNQIVNLCKL